LVDIDLSELVGPTLRTVRRHISSRYLAATRHADQLLDAYSSWLFFERHFLHIGRFGVEEALGMIDTVAVDNVGAAFHLPSRRELPDYTESARRAALMLAAAGLEVDGVARLAPEARSKSRT
jgi:hypothetical protein